VPEPPKNFARKGIDALDFSDDGTKEFYVTFYESGGQIIKICEIKVMSISDIVEGLEDSIGRKYHKRSIDEYYYLLKNNGGEIEYLLEETKSLPGPGLRMELRLNSENEENKKLWMSRTRSIASFPITLLLNNFLRLMHSDRKVAETPF
jgi:hypothetical protein